MSAAYRELFFVCTISQKSKQTTDQAAGAAAMPQHRAAILLRVVMSRVPRVI